ncbi:hypothetical protein [Pseudochrobactrum sp. HB0163]|uniref:hypothetical protein n=1 Tax=Pseudochrobactrum sp. HB0163 TaxID=3450708 RepID=UPI003F6E2C3C
MKTLPSTSSAHNKENAANQSRPALECEEADDGAAAARIQAFNEVLKEIERIQDEFLSPQYATGQPLSSFSERHACRVIAGAVRALKSSGCTGGAV